MLTNDPSWKGQWVWQLSIHRSNALLMPASALCHPHSSAALPSGGPMVLQFQNVAGGTLVLDTPCHLGFQKGHGWLTLGWGVAEAGPGDGSTTASLILKPQGPATSC